MANKTASPFQNIFIRIYQYFHDQEYQISQFLSDFPSMISRPGKVSEVVEEEEEEEGKTVVTSG